MSNVGQTRGERMSEKRLTGRIARENIRLMQVPRPPQGVIDGFLALDLVIADETSVCFVPRERMTDVLALAQEKAEAEDIRGKAIDEGIAVPDISRATYGEKG
jgi:hypothetical protein